MAKLLCVFLIACFTVVNGLAQDIRIEGYFTQDSARLGERVGFVLKASYPQNSQLIFPDSSFDFSPLVLLEKKTYLSQTREGITLDSAVYYLSNFSLDSSVYLALPVYQLSRYDSITHYSNEAELKLKLSLDSIPEQLVFRENNVYQPLKKSFNWLLFFVITGGILLILGILALLFGNKIKGLFRKNRERVRWMQFERKWKKQTSLLQQTPSIQTADEVVGLWKGYMESITGQPFQEWTSSEISEILEDGEVFRFLRDIDLIIYAGRAANTEEACTYLLSIARANYQKKQNQISHERTAR